VTPSSFNGAILPVRGVEVLVVCVRPWVLADRHEAQLFLFAFSTRFGRPVVLMAQDDRGVPSYCGARRLVDALCPLPVEVIPWQRFAYRAPSPPRSRPRSFMLPTPQEPEPSAARDPRNPSAIGHTLDDRAPPAPARPAGPGNRAPPNPTGPARPGNRAPPDPTRTAGPGNACCDGG